MSTFPSSPILKHRGLGIGLVVLALLVLSTFFGSWYTVGSDQRALLFTNGRIVGVEDAGLHFKTPFSQSVTKVDIRTQHADSPAPAGTYDLQAVDTNVSVNFHFDSTKLPDIYKRTGLDVAANIVEPRIQETVKAVVAQYNAEELLKRRELVREKIVELLRGKLAAYDLILEDIQITDFKFDPSFTKAIEDKQVAEQQALTEKNNLAKVQVIAQQAVAKAQGQADSNLAIAKANAQAIDVQGEALRANPMYLELRRIERWDGAYPRVVTGGDKSLLGLGDVTK